MPRQLDLDMPPHFTTLFIDEKYKFIKTDTYNSFWTVFEYEIWRAQHI